MVEPFALNTDGTARDPAAFQSALRSDHAKLQALQTEPDVVSVILGDDIPAMQDMLRSAYQVLSWGIVLVLSLSIDKHLLQLLFACRRSNADAKDNTKGCQNAL